MMRVTDSPLSVLPAELLNSFAEVRRVSYPLDDTSEQRTIGMHHIAILAVAYSEATREIGQSRAVYSTLDNFRD